MDAVFWLGILIGGMVGTALDLWKRPLDRLLDRRLDKRNLGRVEQLAANVKNDRHSLRDYLVEVILQTTLIGSLVGILAGLCFAVGQGLSALGGAGGRIQDALFLAGQLLSILGAWYIVRVAGDALAVARKVEPTPAKPEA